MSENTPSQENRFLVLKKSLKDIQKSSNSSAQTIDSQILCLINELLENLYKFDQNSEKGKWRLFR